MNPKLKQEFLTLHKMLVQNFQSLKLDVNESLESSTKLLKCDFISAELSQEDFFNNYCTYVCTLFTMLKKTTDYVNEMLSGIQKGQCFLTFDENLAFTGFNSNESNARTSSHSRNDVTLVAPKENSYSIDLNLCRRDKNDGNPSVNGNNQFQVNTTIANQTIKRPKIPCGRMDTSVFQIGSTIPCASVCSHDANGSGFCIFIHNCFESELLNQLYNKKDCPTYASYPDQDVVFGMKLEDGIVRAVRCLPLSSKKVYLPDFGDIVDMENNLSNLFILSDEEQNIPGQAIQCQLHDFPNSSDCSDEQSNFFKLPLYKRMSFVVHNIINGVLYLLPGQSTNDEKTTITKESEMCAQLTSQDWELLNEEPPSTTNALKAVLGYVPKDDLRICPHYDPKTDSCFKGSNCRREHIPMPTDYFTKDKEPANLFAEKPTMAPIIYPVNEVLDVLVTHVRSLEYFYGIIIDKKKPTPNSQIWKDSDILDLDYYKVLPLNFDIVLAKYDDGNWYRAQVIDTYEASREVFVFYLDYGNRQIVPLNKIAKCHQSVAARPPQAVQFRLANFHAIKTQEQTIIKRGLSQLINMISDRCIKVSVVSHHEDLLVRFLEEPYCDIPKMLEDMHCVETLEMYW